MNKVQSNHFRMFLSLQAYLDNNVMVWQNIPRIVSYKNMLDEIITRIQSKSEITKLGIGVGQKKDQLKETIAYKGSMLSGILCVIASEQNNTDLADAVKMHKSDILKLKEVDVDATIKKVTTYAKQNLEFLLDFGVNEDVITELITSVDDYNVLIGKPRTILSQKYAALNNIEALFDEGNNIIKQKLDNAMLLFRESQIEFYNGYQNARTIIDN